MNLKNEIKKFVLGFLNPSLFGVYVLITVLSGIAFVTCCFGYGSWYRIGGLLFLIFIPTVFILLLTVILLGRLQVVIWRRWFEQSEVSSKQMPLLEMFWRACLAALVFLLVCGYAGGKFPETRAKRAFADCAPLFSELEMHKKSTGSYPTNVADLIKANAVLRRHYHFYYGRVSTNGVGWTADEVSTPDTIGLFVTTNQFQCVVPIERMSPISFSSFYVYSYTSEHPAWNKTLLHWAYGGAFIDEPKQ